MSEWKEYRLGEVCTELSDGLHKAPNFKKNGDYIFVNAKNIVNGFIIDNDPTKKSTHESFQFLLTSPATDNEVYQITYYNRGDSSLNFTRQNLAKKLNRKEAFFNAVFEMYGYPDDKEELIWGSKNDAYMQVSMGGSAYDASIKLVDVELSDEDYFEASNWKADQEPIYHFGFVE